MELTAAAGCEHDVISSSSQPVTQVKAIEEVTVVKAAMSEEKIANETSFTLNRVIDAGAQTENNEHYIYLDITVKNPTPTEYELTMLNNFYLTLKDGTELSSAVRTQLYAINNLSDKFVKSPFTVPANGEFSGIVGGFSVPEGTNEFTVGFFPTKEDDNNKSNLFQVEVKPSDIIQLPAELQK